MAIPFKTIGLFGRVNSRVVAETLLALIHYLQGLSRPFFIEAETAEKLTLPFACNTLDRDKLGNHCDLLIVVGGDGSLLHAAHTIVDQQLPVIGINRGRLGFLTDVLPTELDRLKMVLDGEYTIENRFLLTATVSVNNKIIATDDALNEVAIIPDAIPHMVEFEIYIDEEFVCSQHSDGLIVATPTGSTAYALSGGGPILHPQLNAIVLVPMFPQALSSRPIVVQGDQLIEVVISSKNSSTSRLTCDGRDYIHAPPKSSIAIAKKKEPLKLVHPLHYHYYKTLRSKLHWGKKLC